MDVSAVHYMDVSAIGMYPMWAFAWTPCTLSDGFLKLAQLKAEVGKQELPSQTKESKSRTCCKDDTRMFKTARQACLYSPH